MVIDNQQKDKILASHFAATNLSDAAVFEAFVHQMHREGKSNQLKHWWNDMDALRTIRAAEHHIKSLTPETAPLSDPIERLCVGKNERIQFMEQPIGKIYSYYRTVLPQEMQIKIAYDSLIERFMGFLQHKKYAIRLSENDLAVQIFVPQIDRNTEFDLSFQWDEFIQFAYSRSELYRSFVLFVNHIKIAQTNRPGAGVGYIRFPPVTKEMADYLAAFYFATLKNQILYDTTYRDSNKSVQNAQTKVEEYNSRLSQSTLTPQKKVLNQKKLKKWQTKLSLARDKFESVKQANQEVLNFSLSELHEQIGDEDFKRIKELSRQFYGRGVAQFGPSVKPKSKNGNIEGTIIDILNESLSSLACPLVSINQNIRSMERRAGDMKGANFCYSCGKLFSKEDEKYETNRFVLGAPSKRPQSGGSETRPNVCGECMTVAFACPVKLTSGAIVMQLAPRVEKTDQSFSIENHLRMLTLGELNLMAGRYLLINCREFVDSNNNRKFVSKEIGQLQYALWQVAQTLPTAALEDMKFRLFTEESDIRLPTRHLVWLSHLHEIFSPHITIKDKNRNKVNTALAQAIRLIQKDEVILAIHELVTAKPIEAKQIGDWSYSEKRSLEELREKHWKLLFEKSSEGDKLMEKQAKFFRDVAALTGLTYTYCSYVFSLLKESKGHDTAKSEVKKLIENVGNPSFFSYGAAHTIPGMRATMYRNDDNYFCYDQAKCLLLELPGREGRGKDAQDSLMIYFDDILNAYAKLSENYNKVEWRNLSYQLKLSLYARFPMLFTEGV